MHGDTKPLMLLCDWVLLGAVRKALTGFGPAPRICICFGNSSLSFSTRSQSGTACWLSHCPIKVSELFTHFLRPLPWLTFLSATIYIHSVSRCFYAKLIISIVQLHAIKAALKWLPSAPPKGLINKILKGVVFDSAESQQANKYTPSFSSPSEALPPISWTHIAKATILTNLPLPFPLPCGWL